MKKLYNVRNFCFAFLLASGLLSAQYSDGVIISNEGNFGKLNAEISFLDYKTLEVTNDIYKTVNKEDLGNVLQNVGFYKDKAYLVVNASNKVIVVNRDTFKKQTVITEGLDQPRYIAFTENKIYVTNQNIKSVNVYNLADNSLLKKIPVNKSTEKIEIIGTNVFVQNGTYGKHITVIDSKTDEIIKTFSFEENIKSIASDGTFLYALSAGNEFTHLYKIDGSTLDIVANKKISNISRGSKLAVSDHIVFFVGDGTKVYGMADTLDDNPIQIVSVPDNSWSTFYGFNVIGNYIFSGDAKGFVAPSEVKLFNVDNGDEVKTIKTSIGVNQFYNNQISNLGVENVEEVALEVNIYPNPAVEFVQIQGVEQAAIEIFDINGRLVKKLEFAGKALRIDDLNAGLYFFVIHTEKGNITKKVLVK